MTARSRETYYRSALPKIYFALQRPDSRCSSAKSNMQSFIVKRGELSQVLSGMSSGVQVGWALSASGDAYGELLPVWGGNAAPKRGGLHPNFRPFISRDRRLLT